MYQPRTNYINAMQIIKGILKQCLWLMSIATWACNPPSKMELPSPDPNGQEKNNHRIIKVTNIKDDARVIIGSNNIAYPDTTVQGPHNTAPDDKSTTRYKGSAIEVDSISNKAVVVIGSHNIIHNDTAPTP